MNSVAGSNHENYVLLVDDDDILRHLYAAYLKRRGYKIGEAGRGQQALDMIEENLPGLVLLDIMMPGMNGLDALRKIREKYSPIELPVILLTALGGNAQVMEGFEYRANDYLVKPVELSELAARARMHLNIREVMNDQREADDRKNAFILHAAHELNGPITTISFGLQIMAESLPELNRALPNYTRMHAMMTEATEAMQGIVNNYLDLHIMQSGRLELEPRQISLNAIAESVVRQLNDYARSKQITIKTELDPRLPSFKADDNRVKQIINNLVNNAVKYSPANTSVDVRTCMFDSRVRMEVADQGPGILPDEVPLLFKENSLLSNRPTGGETSSGVGLTIARYLVEAHGGKIMLVETNPGKGSTFAVEFPI